jgi:hypothetical protein
MVFLLNLEKWFDSFRKCLTKIQCRLTQINPMTVFYTQQSPKSSEIVTFWGIFPEKYSLRDSNTEEWLVHFTRHHPTQSLHGFLRTFRKKRRVSTACFPSTGQGTERQLQCDMVLP